MHTLSAWELLNVWEQGWSQPAAQRALLLLSAAYPNAPPAALAELSVGRRDGHLLALREQIFGPHLASLTACPGCAERLEFGVAVPDLLIADPLVAEQQADNGQAGEELEGVFSLAAADYEVRFRLPNSLDLLAVARCQDPGAARQLLLQRCLLSIRRHGDDADLAQLPTEVVEATVKRMAQSDPQADVRLDLNCPACGHHWQATLDIVSFLWSEIDTWAQRIVRDVHVLASAYGWSETDVLALSPWRRQMYLEMVGR